ELRIDDIERLTAHCREHCTRDPRRVETHAVARDQREAWAMDGKASPFLLERKRAQRPVTAVQRGREGRQSDRRGNGELGARLGGKRAKALFDEQSENGARSVGQE